MLEFLTLAFLTLEFLTLEFITLAFLTLGLLTPLAPLVPMSVFLEARGARILAIRTPAHSGQTDRHYERNGVCECMLVCVSACVRACVSACVRASDHLINWKLGEMVNARPHAHASAPLYDLSMR